MTDRSSGDKPLMMNREQWLRAHDFDVDPFPAKATKAENDDILKNENVFVQVPYYEEIKGTPKSPGYCVIFGECGAGKTAVLKQIKSYYDDLLAKEDQPQVLVIVYNSFQDLPVGDQSKHEDRQILFRAHIEKIIVAILLGLFTIWEDEKRSARIKRINSREVKKQVQWFLVKFLALLPWQFKALKSKLRSYLPLLQYLIRVLLGALSSLLPPARPLADALGTLPTEGSDKREHKYPILDLLKDLIKLCKQVGFQAVYILIDDLDSDYPENEKDEKGFQRIAPLLLNHELHSIDGLILKIFVPQSMEPFYRRSIPKTGRLLDVKMDWTRELLRDVYRRRLRICRKQVSVVDVPDEKAESLADLCEPLELSKQIDELMLQYAQRRGAPRAFIELGFQLLSEHFFSGERYYDELISQETWARAILRTEEVLHDAS